MLRRRTDPPPPPPPLQPRLPQDLPRRINRSYLDVGYARDWLTPDVMKLSRDKDMLMCRATSTVIADLKRISGNKGHPVIVLDSSDDGRAKQIAKVPTLSTQDAMHMNTRTHPNT